MYLTCAGLQSTPPSPMVHHWSSYIPTINHWIFSPYRPFLYASQNTTLTTTFNLLCMNLYYRIPCPTFIEVPENYSDIVVLIFQRIQLGCQFIIETLWKNNFEVGWSELPNQVIMGLEKSDLWGELEYNFPKNFWLRIYIRLSPLPGWNLLTA